MKERLPNCAGVYILDVPYQADRLYSYLIPEKLRETLAPGDFVSLPFGKGNRQQTALVFECTCREDVSELKALTDRLEAGDLHLNEEMRGLCLFLKEQTFCTVGDAVRAMIPTGALRGLCAFYRADRPLTKKLNEAAQMVYARIADETGAEENSGISGEKLEELFGRDVSDLLSALLALKAVKRCYRSEEESGRAYEKVYTLCKEAHPLPTGKKQRAIYDVVSQEGECSLGELTARFGKCTVPLKSMVERGQLSCRKEEIYRRATSVKRQVPDENNLTAEQEEARSCIRALCDTGEPKAALLYGVTGSGKTRVMKAVIDDCLAAGKSVIVLVPEISLTPQTVGLFSAYYGDRVAILHSGLSKGQRYDEWRRMLEGRARICIGTRSAIFAPLENLGLIILDEEQEHTYKSDMSPRYHAKDVARYRCGKNKAVLLLCSATPSVESFYKAREGVYTLCTLKNRYGTAPLPKAILCDMRGGNGMASPLGEVLLGELEKNLERGEQSILFVGRRGYNNFATCTLCGETLTCPHCSVSLTYHSFGRYNPEENSAAERAKHGMLCCHYCGYRRPVPPCCPSCGSNLLQFVGCGTQMVESELNMLFPQARILRLDADTTGQKDAFDTKLESFRKGEADILLGTQMVTKGHDFGNVTLVGVVSADSGLYMDDYRAGEHTFSLITQVIGRAGRGKKPGRAVIQTYNPENPTLILAAKQDYSAFYENEIRLRRALVFPPFCDMVLLTVSGGEEKELQSALRMLDGKLKELRRTEEYKEVPMTVFGPFEAPLYRMKDQFRMRYVLKTRNQKKLRAMLAELQRWFAQSVKGRVLLSIDMNPSSL